MADKNKSGAARIAFTLPISCQICLGKVKVPVVCPNFHVFCSPCMDIWLDKNQQCPTCRVDINKDNPCKKVLGGLSQCDEETDNFSNKDLRQARISLLFKDYEDEIERLQSEAESLKQENTLLHSQLKDLPSSSGGKSTERSAEDATMLINLNKKIQEAQSAHEKLSKDMKKIKKENGDLRDENVNLGRENQRLRLELAQRSPIKYGRITVATLESKVETMEKDIKKYQIALERSDSYVEDIEKERDDLQKKVKLVGLCSDCKYIINDTQEAGPSGLTNGTAETESPDKQEATLHFAKESGTVKKKLFGGTADSQGSTTKTSEPAPKPSPAASFYGKRSVSRQMKQEENKSEEFKQPLSSKYLTSAEKSKLKLDNFHRGNVKPGQRTPKSKSKKLDDTSFELEQPSPSTPSASLSKLTIKTGDTPNSLFSDSSMLSLNETVSSVGSCRKKLKFDGDSSNLDVSFPLPSTSEVLSSDEEISGKLPTRRTSANSDKQVTFSSGMNEQDTRQPKSYSPALLSQEDDPKPAADDSIFEQPSFGFSDDELDPNMTSDIDECMKLLDAAEKKVDQRKGGAKEAASGVPPPIKPALQVPMTTHGLPGGSQSLPFDTTSAFRHFSSVTHPGSMQQGPMTANPEDIGRFGSMMGPGSHLLQTHTDPTMPRRPASTSNLEHMLFPPSSLDGSRSTSAPPPPSDIGGSSYTTANPHHTYDYSSTSRWSTDPYAAGPSSGLPSNQFSSSGSLGLASLLSNMSTSAASSANQNTPYTTSSQNAPYTSSSQNVPYTSSTHGAHPSTSSYIPPSQPNASTSRLGRSLSEPSSLMAQGGGNWVNPGIWNMNMDAKNSQQQLSNLANSYLQQKAAAEVVSVQYMKPGFKSRMKM